MPAKPKNILAVDDEPKILEVVRAFMESRGFKVFTAETGRQALAVFERENIALVLLDLMLPDIPGEELCLAIRKRSRVPVIMLTAKVEEESLLEGLKLGADDYIRKPFSLKELGARAEAALRRAADDLLPLTARNSFRDGDLTVDFEKNAVCKRGRPVSLTPGELRILAALIKYPGKVFTRAELIEIALGDAFDGYDRAIDGHVKNLRRKIEDNSKNPDYILTVYGLGYKFGGE
ncbi:MAG: response regulator transcription factor [Clostridiales Family XIII bacterium]|jgi:DNA-binding response OmpR family regulator|nr:response regulator transcription factor [Clostridiales Family XIII bacterium]